MGSFPETKIDPAHYAPINVNPVGGGGGGAGGAGKGGGF